MNVRVCVYVEGGVFFVKRRNMRKHHNPTVVVLQSVADGILGTGRYLLMQLTHSIQSLHNTIAECP